MIKIVFFAAVLMFVCASQCSGNWFSRSLTGIGLGDTAMREAGSQDNETVNNIRKVSKPIGIVSSGRDVVMVGTTAATVSGSSGSAIISGMAAIGKPVAAVTSGAVSATVAGTAIASGSAGLGAAGLLNEFIFDGDTKGDQAARIGTYSGAIGATAGGVATIAGAGTVGLSAAGITSGLASIGAVVGGGMAAGTILVVAAPVAAAASIGSLAYWLFSD